MKKYKVEGFDYEKVAKMMAAVNWRWFTTPIGRSPTVDEIKAKVQELISDVEKMDIGSSLQGAGFLVEKLHEEDSPVGTIQVSFIGDRGWVYPAIKKLAKR